MAGEHVLDIVVSRKVTLITSGNREIGAIDLYSPYEDSDGFSCSFSIKSESFAYENTARGIDKMQAVLIAFTGIREKLLELGSDAVFLDAPAHFSMPELIFPDFIAHSRGGS